MTSRVRRALLTLPLFLVFSGCNVALGSLAGRATDEWTRSYPLAEGGEVQIGNTNGLVEVEAATGSRVDIRAERIATATTDAAARELLPRIVIKEDIRPDRVSVESERMSGFMIGASYEVRYHVRVPKGAVVRATATNGRIVLTGLDGQAVAQTTNGGVTAKDLTGPISAEATNGSVTVDLAALGRDKIELHTTNGAVALTVPHDAKADLTASVTNGAISITGLQLEASEQSRRKVSGRLNGGGTPIAVSTTNGAIRITGK